MMSFKYYGVICSLLLLPLHFLTAQSPATDVRSKNHFIDMVQNAANPFQIQTKNLSDFTIQVYWISSDRRYAKCFVDRLKSYTLESNVTLEYRWTWPEEKSGRSLTLFVADPNTPVPAQMDPDSQVLIICGNSSGNSLPADLPLYVTGQNYSCQTMDLLAQYLFKGITITDDEKLDTGERISFLSADYMGLDEQWIKHRLDSILQTGLDSMAYPGAELAIVYKGSVIYQKNLGYHSYDRQYLVRDKDLYDLASVTKVTAGVSSLMALYDKGEFDINQPLETYFPYFKNSDKAKLSMKRVLTHSAGLKPYMVYYKMAEDPKRGYQKHTFASSYYGEYTYPISDSIYVSDQFNQFIYQAIDTSGLGPQKKYVYSGLSFLLYPDLIRRKTGETIDRFLYSNIYEPMGAFTIKYNPSHHFHIHQIPPTEQDDIWRHKMVQGQVHDEAAAVLGGVSTNAGLFSNALDLVKLGETWRRKGTYGGHRYWSPSTIELFTSCGYCEEGNRRALGFDRPPLPGSDYTSYMSPLASQSSFGHSGFTGTMIWVDPEYSYTFVFLSNRVHPTRTNTKLYSMDIRPELHSVLYKALNKKRR